MSKSCGNCKNHSICKLRSGMWDLWRGDLQGNVNNNVLHKLLRVLCSNCKLWTKDD